MLKDLIIQSHRGGLGEMPENTMAAYRTSWEKGALPEIDVRTTIDRVLICLHDATLARTTSASDTMKDADVSTLTASQVRRWDAGSHFSSIYQNERVPLLSQVFEAMAADSSRQAYLDYKNVDIDQLAAEINKYGIVKQLYFSHNLPDTCAALKKVLPGVRTMVWISGSAASIRATYKKLAATGFRGLDQIQFHLDFQNKGNSFKYALSKAFIEEARDETGSKGVSLQLYPFDFDDASLHGLLDLGIRSFATDYPARLIDTAKRWGK